MIKKLTDNLLLIEVSNEAKYFKCWHSTETNLCTQLEYYLDDDLEAVELNKGKYKILGEWFSENGLNIYHPLGNIDVPTIGAKELESKGFFLTEKNKFILILKK